MNYCIVPCYINKIIILFILTNKILNKNRQREESHFLYFKNSCWTFSMESAVKQGIPLILVLLMAQFRLWLICVRVKQVKIFIYTFNSLNWELVNSRPLKQPRYAGRIKHKCLNNVSEHHRENSTTISINLLSSIKILFYTNWDLNVYQSQTHFDFLYRPTLDGMDK